MCSEFRHARVGVFKTCIFNHVCYTRIFTFFKGPYVTRVLYSSLLEKIFIKGRIWYNVRYYISNWNIYLPNQEFVCITGQTSYNECFIVVVCITGQKSYIELFHCGDFVGRSGSVGRAGALVLHQGMGGLPVLQSRPERSLRVPKPSLGPPRVWRGNQGHLRNLLCKYPT